jgi:hypothetical protein
MLRKIPQRNTSGRKPNPTTLALALRKVPRQSCEAMADDIITPDDLDRLRITGADIVRLDQVKLRARKKTRAVARRATAARIRLYRQRKRLGQVVYKVTVAECALVEYLIATGRLSEAESFARQRVERAVGELLEELAARWRSQKK